MPFFGMLATARHEDRLDVVEKQHRALPLLRKACFGMHENVPNPLFALAVAGAGNLAAIDEGQHDRRLTVAPESFPEFISEALGHRGLASAGRAAEHEPLDQPARRRRAPLM